MVGVKRLTIGYTKDIDLAEEIAKDAGAEELIIRVCPEGNTLHLSREERLQWISRGWRLQEATAYKRLVRKPSVRRRLRRSRHDEGDSEGGRLKSSMLYPNKDS